jgi:hypothetical protein
MSMNVTVNTCATFANFPLDLHNDHIHTLTRRLQDVRSSLVSWMKPFSPFAACLSPKDMHEV